MKHDFALDSDGDIDDFDLAGGYHNGPYCMRCEEYFCKHCERNVFEEECSSGQLNLPL